MIEKRSVAGRIAAWVAKVSVATIISAGSAYAASGDLATQSPAAAQPTLPKTMPDLTVPVGPSEPTKPAGRARAGVTRHGVRHARRYGSPALADRPALANVELLEQLPRPPQPPHVTVPTPAYPLENFVTAFTTPPPPITCRPTRRDRFKPDLGLVDERPVLCTADNP